nr:hypothetical protein [Tanacetum cinerariifolium]
MGTRSSYNLPVVSSNPSTSNPKRRNRMRSKQPFILEESLIDTMADQCTMAKLLPDQDSLNAAAGGNLLERRTQDVLTIIENKSKVRNSQNKSVVSQVKSNDANSNSSSEIAKLTHAVNQQTSAVTTAMTAILKQFQATPPPASVKAVEEICVTCGGAHPYYQCLAAGGNTFSELQDNIQGYLHVNITLVDALILMPKYQKMLKALLSNKEKLQELENTPLNENCSAVILNKLPEKLGDPGKFIIPCGFSELKCKALANLGASINLMPLSVWKKLADFVIVDYESDPRIPLILERPFLWTARALIDIHGDEMILRDGDEILTLNMRHDTLSYSNQPQRESINLINIFNNSKGGKVLSEKLLDLDSTKDLHPPLHVNQLSGATTYSSSPLLEEFADELALITFPPKYDDNLYNLANPGDNFVDSMREMFTDEHALDYSSPPIFDEYDDDFLEFESDAENVYDDPFDSKIKESKLLIDELDLPCDFLPPSEYDSFISHDFSRVDALLSTNNEDKVFNPCILIQENPFEIITRVVQDKKLAISNASLVLEDFDRPFYEPLYFKEVPRSMMILSFSSKNEEKVFKPGIHTSAKVHSSFITEPSHQGYKVFKINQIFKSSMKIFLFSCGKDTHILVVPCLYFYPS